VSSTALPLSITARAARTGTCGVAHGGDGACFEVRAIHDGSIELMLAVFVERRAEPALKCGSSTARQRWSERHRPRYRLALRMAQPARRASAICSASARSRSLWRLRSNVSHHHSRWRFPSLSGLMSSAYLHRHAA